jgi:hypothetical protein
LNALIMQCSSTPLRGCSARKRRPLREGGANAGPLAGTGLRPDGGKRSPDGRENKDQKSSFTSSLTW